MYVQINTKQADQFDFAIYTLNNINPIFLYWFGTQFIGKA